MLANYLARSSLLLLFLSFLVGCEETMDSNFSRTLWNYERGTVFPQRFDEYKATPHYRALATGYIDRRETIFFPTTGHETVGEAIEAAYAGCDLTLEKRDRDWGCDLFAIGNIDIRGMTQEQLQQVIELYESNTSATNEDFDTISEQTNESAPDT